MNPFECGVGGPAVPGRAAVPRGFAEPGKGPELEGFRKDAAFIAHDLRNLLASVLGHLELHEHRIGDREPDLRESFSAMRLAAGQAVGICEDLLAMSHGGRDELRPLDLGSAARRAAELFRSRSGDCVPCQLEGPTGVRVMGHRTRLERAILNLLWNGLEAALEGRSLARGGTGPAPAAGAGGIRVRWGSGPTAPWLEVQDSGPGLPDGRLGALIQAFRSGRAEPDDTLRGLGLTSVVSVMRLHGGRLVGRNAGAGGGAVMRLEFGVEPELDFGSA